MAREITAGVLLKLKDQFSSQIRGAGISVQGFADKAVGVAEKVNKAFSGVAGTMGTLGVSIGALSAVKSTIDLDDRMVRLGLTANLSAREVNELKRTIFDVAQMPDIKLDTDPIISGLEVILEKTGDIGQVGRENIANLARAIKAAGTEGSAMGDVFSEFAKNKFSAQEITQLMDDIITISDMGEYTFLNFANTAKSVLSSYSLIGNTPKDVRNAVIAMQVLTAGTKSANVAATALDSTMRELSDPTKRGALEHLGITVRNNATGEMRDFNDILADVAAAYEDFRKADYINTIFGSETQKAIRAYNSEFARNIPRMRDLGDTAGTLEQKSATMANTLKSNFQNLQTAFLSFADTNLTGPLQKLTDLLNKLAENPEKIEAGIRGIAIAIGGLAAVKIGAGFISFVGSLNNLKSGGKLNVDGLANAGGGAGIPVHVTNWGGTAGSSMMSGVGNGSPAVGSSGSPAQPALLNNKPPLESARTAVGNITGRQYAAGAAGAGIGAALVEIPQMISELHAIDQNEALSTKERGEAKGGAIGDATGSIIGAAAGGAAGIATGAAVGAAVGSVVPVLGTAVGALVGAGVGALGMWLGGKAGRTVGTAIGGAVSGDDETAAQNLESIYNNSVTMYPGITPASPDIAYYNAVTHYPGIAHNTTVTNPVSVNDLILTPQGQFNTHPDDYIIAMKDPAALVNAGLPAVHNRYQTFQEAPGVIQHNANTSSVQMLNDLTPTPQNQFSALSDDYGVAMREPAGLVNAGLPAVNNRYQTFQETPGIVQHNTNTSNAQTVNDVSTTPQSRFNASPDDYIFAMKNPAALVTNEIRNEMRSVERVPPAIPPVIVNGEIELRSELTIDDKGYRLRQSVGRNTTPYKFAVGSASNARLTQ